MRDIVDWIRQVFLRLRERIKAILESLFGYGRYPDDWRWDLDRKRWIYTKSEGDGLKGYNCTEYVVARIESRAPKWGGSEETTTETTEIMEKLGALGWIQREGGCNCGCDEGQSKDCVVVYVENGEVVHAAIFDHVRCDWGGKLLPGMPIARYRRPVDYYEEGRVPNGGQMLFFCPRRPGEPDGEPVVTPQPGGQKTDE